MPDVHAGKGCTVGTTMLIDNKVCPNLVGVDIGCGVEVYKIKETELDLEKLDNMLQENVKVPYGFSKRNFPHEFSNLTRLKNSNVLITLITIMQCFL
jgi:hypothetical protein